MAAAEGDDVDEGEEFPLLLQAATKATGARAAAANTKRIGLPTEGYSFTNRMRKHAPIT